MHDEGEQHGCEQLFCSHATARAALNVTCKTVIAEALHKKSVFTGFAG